MGALKGFCYCKGRLVCLLGGMVFGFWLAVCRHTASTPITAGKHTSGAQYEGGLQNSDRIERHS